MGPFFPPVGLGLQTLPGSFLEDVARLGLFAHGEWKEGWPGREFAGIGADRISVETVTCLDILYAMCCFFGGENFLIGDEETHGKQRGSVINYYGSCMDRLFQFFFNVEETWKKGGICDYGSCMDFLRRFLVERNGGNSNVNIRHLYENTRNDRPGEWYQKRYW